MRLLLDTQIYLWFLADARRLGKPARQMIDDANEVYVSAASIWEAGIKSTIGKLDVDMGHLVTGIHGSGFKEIAVSAKHAANASRLPPLHRDPFDRLLIAQATTEPLHLLTGDTVLRDYSKLVVCVQ